MFFARYKKVVISILIVVILLLLATGTLIFFKYQSLEKQNIPVEQTGEAIKIAPGDEVALGTPVTVTTLLKCPWNRQPEIARVEPGKGAQAVGQPAISLEKIRWGYWIWSVSAKLQPYQTGVVKGSKLIVAMDQMENEKLTVDLPEVTAQSLNVTDQDTLSMADSVIPKVLTNNRHLILALCVCAAVIVIIIVLFFWLRARKNKKAISLPPWAIALSEIQELSAHVKRGLITKELCVGKLTDIVRCYIEKRFRLRAQRQTTCEFLTDLEKPGSPLAHEHRNFLKEFLSAADLVKFANLPADDTLIQNTISRATDLVNVTKSSEENSSTSPETAEGGSPRQQQTTNEKTSNKNNE